MLNHEIDIVLHVILNYPWNNLTVFIKISETEISTIIGLLESIVIDVCPVYIHHPDSIAVPIRELGQFSLRFLSQFLSRLSSSCHRNSWTIVCLWYSPISSAIALTMHNKLRSLSTFRAFGYFEAVIVHEFFYIFYEIGQICTKVRNKQ